MKRGLLYVFVILCAMSCRDNLIPDETINVEDTFSIDLFEALDGADRSFQIKARSIESEECTNAIIGYTLKNSPSLVSVSFNDITTDGACEVGMAPAQSTVELGGIENGTYTMQLNLKEVVFNNGSLVVTDEAFELSMNSENGINLIRSELKRIPQNLVWGYVAYDNTSLNEACNQLLTDATNLMIPSNLTDGYYGYFDLNQQVLTPVEGPNKIVVKPFYGLLDASLDDLGAIAENFRENYQGQGAELRLFTWRGEEL